MRILLPACLVILVLSGCKNNSDRDTRSSGDEPIIELDKTFPDTVIIHDTITIKPPADTIPNVAQVYITPDGDKYHTADCRYSKDATPLSLQQAKTSGKTACGICKPHSKTGDTQMRCSAKTKEGKQCQRMTSSPGGKCYQHQSN